MCYVSEPLTDITTHSIITQIRIFNQLQPAFKHIHTLKAKYATNGHSPPEKTELEAENEFEVEKSKEASDSDSESEVGGVV